MNLWLLLGRRDTPTDGVEEYCQFLAQALRRRQHSAQIVRVPWIEVGWQAGLKRMYASLRDSPSNWVVMQFTNLMWSRRGFPVRALAVAGVARLAGKNLCIVFHDPSGFSGSYLRDRIRRLVQHSVMRALVSISQQSVLTVSHQGAPWIRRGKGAVPKVIPVGSNIPPRVVPVEMRTDGHLFTIGVFGVTEGHVHEAREIAEVANRSAAELGAVQLLLFGRGVDAATSWVRQCIESGVLVKAGGVMLPETVSEWLRSLDVLLFLRGVVSSGRTTAVAAIAHGLPVVGCYGNETAEPITEAGVALVAPGDIPGLSREVVRIARDAQFANELRRRSEDAYKRYFSWDRIAEQFEEALRCAQ
jgi:glycosyltransferase involved in cell wall biosynthesis